MTTNETLGQIEEALRRFEVEPDAALARLSDLYDDGVVFQDPLQRLEGRDAFMEMNRRIARRARRMAFELEDAVAVDDRIFLTWRMVYAPKVGPTMRFDGATHLRLSDGRVVHHRDYWDLIGDVTAAIPGVGRAWRAIARHLA